VSPPGSSRSPRQSARSTLHHASLGTSATGPHFLPGHLPPLFGGGARRPRPGFRPPSGAAWTAPRPCLR
jgi:hypothetical protein